MNIAMSLVAVAAGYLVLTQAEKEKGGLKSLGRILGAVIILAAVLSGLCELKCKHGGCPFSGKAPMCHVSLKTPEPAAS